MTLSHIRWGRALAGAFGAEFVLAAAAVGWVAVYSYALHPDASLAFYRQYALLSGPWISLLLGFPVFFVATRWAGAFAPSSALPTALGLAAIYLTFDAPIVLLGDNPYLDLRLVALAYALKLAACYFGGRSAARDTPPA